MNLDFINKLNPQQRSAVTAADGPVLVVAGPGSGKTRVLTQRIAYLIANEGVRPWQILAVTFTNKAAKEMDARVKAMLNEQATEGIMLGTFHSICARILRREAEHLPIEPNFVIFDSDDQQSLTKAIIREMNLNEKLYRAQSVHASISRAKNELILPDDFPINTYRDEVVKRVYTEYQKRLIASNAVDFDDILVYTARLLEDNPAVRDKYAQRFRHVLVDEFQDTNLAQYALVKHLASHHKNIFCVGDPDQCFPAGVKIQTPHGQKKIEDVKRGDDVTAASGRGSVMTSKVAHAGKRMFKGNLVRIKTKNGHIIRATPNHIMFAIPVLAGLKPPSQHMEALRAGKRAESDLSDFHVLRQDFSPTITADNGAFFTSNPTLEFSLMPASHLHPSMIVAIEKNGQIVEDEIIEVTHEPYNGTVYDFEVENLHNYIANGVVVHNSIYAWRGADYRNIRRFEQDFPDSQTILLEQNYRSHQNILDVAMGVINRASNRRKKRLFSDRGAGEKIFFYEARDDFGEASFVVDTIAQLVASGDFEPKDCAVMYRTNAMSRLLEEAFLQARLPYKLVGAQRFYGRREVKDMIAFLRLAHNPADEAALGRIINVPPRGIGAKTLTTLHLVARQNNTTAGAILLDLARGAKSPFYKSFTGRAAVPLADFGGMFANWHALTKNATVSELFDRIVRDINYKEHIVEDDTEESLDRWENVQELKRLALEYDTRTLDEFLENVALIADQDTITDANAPTLLTLHAAKGLEYGAVFIVGLDDGIIPHSRSFDEPEQMEEERRLFYVGITRAKDRLYLLRAIQRGGRGMAEETFPSRFMDDIPTDMLVGRTRTGRSMRGAPSDIKWSLPSPSPLRPSPAGRGVGGEGQALYKAGTRVQHPTWGDGIVLNSHMQDGDEIIDVVFESVGIKRLAASLANLSVISDQ